MALGGDELTHFDISFSLKITDLRLLPHLPGANELISCSLGGSFSFCADIQFVVPLGDKVAHFEIMFRCPYLTHWG